jgi:predicted CXXCH cytochrome family protein
MVNRKARNLLIFAAVLLALGVGSTRRASAEVAVEWDNATCLQCHSDPGFSTELPSGEALDLTIDEDRWNRSIHAEWDMKCVFCHTEITAIPHDSPSFDDSREYAIRKSEACIVCHRDQEVIEDSVHAQAREEGNDQAAVCSDCHDPHYTTDPPISHTAIPETCRSCHAGIYNRYTESVHGSALTEGNLDVPTCTDCHGVHEIAGPSRGTFHLFSPEICASCHADEELMGKYGIKTDVFSTYVADFHGRTITLFQEITPDQATNAPVCVSCHGVHDIRSADEAGSTVAKENLLTTCQHCHPNADTAFPEAWMSHYSASPDEWPIVYYVRLFYRIVIPVVIGGMLIYIAIDVTGRRRRRKGVPSD